MNRSEINEFVENFRKAFGNAKLPIVFYYKRDIVTEETRTKGCFIGALKKAREGEEVVFTKESIGCGGGRVYCGFARPLPHIPDFVSREEYYKETPEMVSEFLNRLKLDKLIEDKIVFNRIDKIDNPEDIIGVIFFATPDVLTGLISWTFYDTNTSEAVSVPFGSGCSSTIAQTYHENKINGKRCFLGMFDPSARPLVEANVMTYSIPMSRFQEMVKTMTECCIIKSNAWQKVKKRING